MGRQMNACVIFATMLVSCLMAHAETKESRKQADQFVGKTGQVTLRLLASPDPQLPIEFRPTRQAVRGQVNKEHQFTYMIRNLSDRHLRVSVRSQVEPKSVEGMLELMDCPCDQPLDIAPHESRNLVMRYKVVPTGTFATDIWQLRFKISATP